MVPQINIEAQDAQLILDAVSRPPLETSLDTWLKVKGQAEPRLQQQAPDTPVPGTPQAKA